MAERSISSRFYGNLGVYRQIRSGLYRSASERIHLLGSESVGGKGEGLLVLDNQKQAGFDLPRLLIICSDFFSLPHQQSAGVVPIATLKAEKVSELIDTINGLNFPAALAIRSSAAVEDQVGGTGAGKFATEFHALALDTAESRQRFTAKLLTVCNSAYAPEAVQYWQKHGYTEIPPISVVIQEVVGSKWAYAPQYFMPAVSGIVNTASRRIVRVSTVLGLGLAAVGDAGLGTLHKLPILSDGKSVYHNMGHYFGKLNGNNIFCLDLTAGNAVNLLEQAALDNFPEKEVKNLRWRFPDIQMALAELGLGFERGFGNPFDLEWASRDGQDISLVQIRPIKKKDVIARPVVDPGDIIIQSRQVVGYGEKTFDHVIYISSRYYSEEEVKNLTAKYPKSLIILATQVVEGFGDYGTGKAIAKRLFPYTEAVIVLDSAEHMRGTGLQHLALDCADEGKILIYLDRESSGNNIFKKIRMKTKMVKGRSAGGMFDSTMEAYKFKRPVRLAADDEFDWGMVYFG